MGNMREVTDATWDEQVLAAERPVVVDFWAPWCGPCRVMEPILDELAGERGDIEFVKLNVDDNFKTAARYDILSIPTLLVFAGGEVKRTLIGTVNRAKLEHELAGLAPVA